MIGQHASPAYRIYNGDTILVTLWSNVAAAVDGFFRVVYDDGTTDTLRIDRVTTTSARAAFLARAAHVAKHDGYVTEGVLFADSAQRGQTYAIAYVSQGEGPGDVRMALCKGYVYASTPLAVGQQVEPGPAGGPGAISSFNLAQPVAGFDVAVQAVPTGAIWKLRGVFMQLVSGVTAGNREVAVQYMDASGTVRGGAVAPEIQGPSLTVDYYGIGSGATPSGVSASLATGTVGMGLGDLALLAGFSIQVKTYNLQGLDQWTGTSRFAVEEWVMPN